MPTLRICSFCLLALTAACQPSPLPCQRDADCESGLCIADLDRGDRYCSRRCTGDGDCPPVQRCELRLTGDSGEQGSVQLCVERVRDCGGSESCNGLDDDCDGAIDDGCARLACTDDVACGGYWPCAPDPEGDADFVCQPPLGGAAAGSPCSEGGDCYNGLCEIGRCAAICRLDEHCGSGDRCAAPSAPGSATQHNTCHRACDQFTPCPAGEACTLRADPFGCRWRAVCSPQRGILTYGSHCLAHDDCNSALCAAGRCTRPCVDSHDCTGLWANAECGFVASNPGPAPCGIAEIKVCR
ncbi:MAG: hypothetical protein JXR83_11590 [Deltaproteobacteria bacterium]|nr:hypothetical protein [Deltaproteobacteria bacterium]